MTLVEYRIMKKKITKKMNATLFRFILIFFLSKSVKFKSNLFIIILLSLLLFMTF